jgi:methylated-DNA-protein-cysteine methyltransferase related protein
MRNFDFFEKVFEVVAQIPYGKVTTYGAIAKSIGAKSSSRMVGYALNSTLGKPNKLPCHRVVNRFGQLSGKKYFETPFIMRELLENEGIEFIDDRVNLEKHLWLPIESLYK